MSNFNSNVHMTGDVSVKRFTNGKLIEKREIKNLVVQTGKDFIASRMVGTSQAVMSHMGIGSNSPSTPAANAQTALVNEDLPRVAISNSVIGTNPASVTYVATFGAGVGTGSIGEAGIFNAATGGTMLARTTFTAIPKEADDVIEITWTITIN